MAEADSNLVAAILREYFGPSAELVAVELMKSGRLPLRLIAHQSGLTLAKVKKVLLVFHQHHFLQVMPHPVKSFLEYHLKPEAVIRVLRFPRYVIASKTISSDKLVPISEFIVMEVLKEGKMMIESLVKVFNSLSQNDATLMDLESAFLELFQANLISVSVDVRSQSYQDQLDYTDPALKQRSVPESTIKSLFAATKVKTEVSADEPQSKRVKTHGKEDDVSLYFEVNYEKADQLLRDAIITDSLHNRFADESVAIVAESLIRLTSSMTDPGSPVSDSVSLDTITKNIASAKLSEVEIQSCLDVLVEETDFGIKPVERLAGGGMYCMDSLKIMTKIVEALLAAIVEQKFGSRYARVFRILVAHKSLPQKVVEDNALMPPKDCKEIVFTLAREGFVTTNYYSRAVDYAPAKTHFLFSIDLEQVTRKVIGICSHSIVAAITRRNHEYDSNRLLIERKVHVDQQVALLQQQEGAEQQISDLQATFTARDRELIATAEKASRTLHLAEIQVEETLFVLQSWLKLKLTNDAIKD